MKQEQVIESQWVPISKVKPNPKNPRTIRDSKFEKLVNSLRELPEMAEVRELICNTKGVILAGNQRYKAMKELGWKRVPVRYVDWAEEQVRRFIVTDNVGYGEWTEDLLQDWGRDELEAWGMDIPDFGTPVGWNPPKTDEAKAGDGIFERVGYGLQSFWKDISATNSELNSHFIDLPPQEKTDLVGQKYSRTNLEEIRRVVKTYMREGDYFLENCCGWSTFGCTAALLGFSGKGVDIWDTAIKHSRRQYTALTDAKLPVGEYEVIDADGRALPFEDNTFDFVYCNPPFMDQEKYSGKPEDIASSDEKEFASKFREMMAENFRVVKPGNLCVITINDMRKAGHLEPLQARVIEYGISVGFRLWDFVVAEVQSQKIRLRAKDYEKRRTVKCHEYVIVFKKP